MSTTVTDATDIAASGTDRFLSSEGRRIATAVRELRPRIQAAGRQAEIDRRMPDDIVAALTETGLFLTAVPIEYGGLALGARDIAEIALELGRADSSAAWLFMVACGARMVSTFPKPLVDDLYGGMEGWRGPIAAGGSTFAAITGEARKVDGGWMVTGKWTFVSGNHHASRIFGGVHWVDGEREGHALVMFDPDQLERLDDWQVAGMSGSDSNSMRATEEVFVPDHRFLDMAELPVHMDSASERFSGLAYQAKTRASMLTVSIITIGSVVGMAGGCFDAFTAQTSKRPFSPPYPSVAEMATSQAAAAKARAAIDVAEALILRIADAIDAHALSGTDFTSGEESQANVDLAYVGQLCHDAMQSMARIIGSSAYALSNPIQRYVRDAAVILSHGAVRLESLAEISGRHLLGQPPFDMFVAGLQNKGTSR